ncbi:MAG TPA: dihydrolipoyllysine-residue acetyltransferase [Candidatus Dormibacteraeota bacterium]|nr:dihydrolipoyllysine-residue acetyltransferase [Candidatus Dormibacteraeota bacterium]
MSESIEVQVPDIGDFKGIPVIEVLVKPGDRVERDDPLVMLESEKATMEVPAPTAGVVEALRVGVGDKVSQGSAILTLTATDAPVAPAPAPAAPAAAPGGAERLLELRVPDVGDFHDIPVIDVSLRPGDAVELEDTVATLESEKATMEVPATAAGTVRDVLVKVGDKVSEGTLLAIVSAAGAPAPREPQAAAPAPAAAPAAPPAAAPAAAPIPSSAGEGGVVHASPSIRRFARELGVDLRSVEGSGPNGRITRDDVQDFVKRALATGMPSGGAGLGVAPWPKIDFAQFGPIELQPLSRIKKISGPNLHRNWVMIPHVTNHEDADVTELEAFRQMLNAENAKTGVKVTLLAFLIKAVVAALQRFPDFNASLDGDNLVLKKYYHIGFAADTPGGLVVPVVKDADKKGILAIAAETSALAAKARDGKLSLGEMQGGTFTISSLGGIGGTYFTPIINAPEVAILGACRASTRPVWNGTEFVARSILPLSLSYDHRVIDGASAARFNVYLAALLADLRRVVL